MAESNEGGKFNSVENTEEDANRRMKCTEEDDLISGLPDSLIQHILSFLPSTQDSIRTGILSKRWLYQWTCVPVLIFDSEEGIPNGNVPNFIENVLNLYECSKINKFVIASIDFDLDEMRPKLASWIRFATARDVKELILEYDHDDQYQLPQFLFKNEFLVKFKTRCCAFNPKKGKVNWASLKALHISFASLPDNAIENVLSGSPVIEHLELHCCEDFEQLAIVSKSLKTLRMFDSGCSVVEISCPNLEKLQLLGQMSIRCLKLKDLPPSVHVTFDFRTGNWHFSDVDDELECVKKFLLQVQHVEKLKIGSWFMTMLSLAAERGESSLLLNNKCLTVIDPLSEVIQPELAISLLRFSLLEKLVIKLQEEQHFDLMETMEIGKKFFELDGGVFDSSVTHLKIVEIVGLYDVSEDGEHDNVLKFVEFLLKNARILEKLVLREHRGEGMLFAREVCKELSYIRKASPHAIVEVARIKWYNSKPSWDKIDY